MSAAYACCYWGVSASKSSHHTKQWDVCVYVCAYVYVSVCV